MQETTKKEAVGSYGDWRVMPDGEIRHVVKRLRIYPDRLREPDWWAKLYHGVPWMADQWNTFMPAWVLACEISGIKKIEIQIEL